MQVGEISAYNLEKDFSEFYYQMSGQRWDFVTRVLHNQEQVIRCQLRDDTASPQARVKYWNMDGSEAAQFTIGSGGIPYTNILDVAWLTDEEKLCYVSMHDSGVGLGSSGYSIIQALPDGASPEVLVRDISTASTTTWSGASTSGYVGLTVSDDYIFLKIGPEFHKIDRSALGAGTDDWATLVGGGYVESATDCFHFGDGSACYNMMYQEEAGTPGYVLYTWYDSNIDALYLRSISVSGSNLEYVTDRWTLLGISQYADFQYPIFINQLDPDSLHFLKVDDTAINGVTVDETPAYFQVFNIDDTLAQFVNVNSSDSVMPAGIGATSIITAKVANCWGTTLSGKLVQFWVSSGDGGVYPTFSYTDATGRTTTTFTTGANVGISNVAVVVNEV